MLPRPFAPAPARLLLRRTAAGSLAALLIGGLSACSDDAGGGDPDNGPAATAQPLTGSNGISSGSADPATDPSGPFVVAATAVAERSREVVVRLHVLAVATTEDGELPAANIGELAAAARRDFAELVGDATMMTPPKGSAAEALVSSLTTYGRLGRILAAWRSSDRPLGEGFFVDLAIADKAWKSALVDLQELSGTPLLDVVPDLAFPQTA